MPLGSALPAKAAETSQPSGFKMVPRVSNSHASYSLIAASLSNTVVSSTASLPISHAIPSNMAMTALLEIGRPIEKLCATTCLLALYLFFGSRGGIGGDDESGCSGAGAGGRGGGDRGKERERRVGRGGGRGCGRGGCEDEAEGVSLY
mmetsp:Transcript_45254/g.66371  ORF Transcript_45254/g.66371 Transcript_45254/m.66371 type:complete len:148 (+) Transcript_45254:337-780(+)